LKFGRFSTPDSVEYVREPIAGVGEIRHKKMFSEYLVYINDNPPFSHPRLPPKIAVNLPSP
jgi:hypothetical protein